MEVVETRQRGEYQPGTKKVFVKFAGRTRQPQEVFVGPGTSASELLEHLGLRGNEFQISKGTPGTVFGRDEIVYPQIEDGDLIYCTSIVDAGD